MSVGFATKAFRVRVLLVLLTGVLVWSGYTFARRAARVRWTRPLEVSVVLISTEVIPEDVGFGWRQSLPRLEQWLTAQMRRYREPAGDQAVHFTIGRPVQLDQLPVFEPATEELSDRAEFMLQLNGALKEVERKSLLPTGSYDARLFVVLTAEAPEELARVEGIAARGGDIGMVRAPVTAKSVDLELAALAHELFHCLGAADAYDAEGHAKVPEGLVDPEKQPLYPQRAAEVMVGEIPVGLHEGKVPRTLDEVEVGPFTAAALKWVN